MMKRAMAGYTFVIYLSTILKSSLSAKLLQVYPKGKVEIKLRKMQIVEKIIRP